MLSSDADSADIVVDNTNDSGAGSLREAIGTAASGDRIVFDIPGGGTITLGSDLPTITDTVIFANDNVAAVTIDRVGFGPISFTGGTIDLGELNLTGVAGPDVTLAPATTLIGDADQITGDVTASGVIAPGADSNTGTVGTLFITGDLDATDSTIQVDILGDVPSNDLIDVAGDVTVTDATLIPTFAGADYSVGDTFSVIEATGTVTPAFANAAEVFELSSNPFLEATINTLPSSVELEVRDNGATFVSVLEGCNQLAAAAELDRLRLGPPATAGQLAAITNLRDGSATDVSNAVNQLSGTIYTSLVDGQIQQIQNNIHGFRDRIVFHSDSANEVGRWSPWARAYGSSMSVDADECLTLGYRQESAGVDLGTGRMWASGIGVHGFARLGSTDTQLRGVNQNADTDSYRFGGSVQYFGEVIYLVGAGGFGFQDYSAERSLSEFGAGESASSQFDGSDQFVYVEAGTALTGVDSVLLSFVSLQGIRVETDSMTETGASEFGLSVNGMDEDSVRSMVGLSLSKSDMTGIGMATTQIRGGWPHEFGDTTRVAANRLADAVGPGDFSVQSADTGRDWLSLGGQVDWAILFGGQLTLAYQGNLNDRSAFQSGLVGARWIW
ncbi:autotransporter family protein [Rhodopirellula sp. P2]|uniref:autotransporter family protein n=1 Tax=Rhodopirellula sp. P2 TaxID=2127060 RepID=UPI002367DB1D|nr:autotransporter outer membrane beta-barrel domain-containing protein [Rhodopirellula sp. P2]WDQ14968.1 autotransporter domain-containing protein [Rhodopirellula sp. P2]